MCKCKLRNTEPKVGCCCFLPEIGTFDADGMELGKSEKSCCGSDFHYMEKDQLIYSLETLDVEQPCCGKEKIIYGFKDPTIASENKIIQGTEGEDGEDGMPFPRIEFIGKPYTCSQKLQLMLYLDVKQHRYHVVCPAGISPERKMGIIGTVVAMDLTVSQNQKLPIFNPYKR